MPTIKKLQFANGTDVTEPTDLSLESSTDHLKTYADDAAYVADNGAASAGDIYINTTMNTARLYAGGQWWSVVIKENAIIVDDNFKLVDNGDNTKVGKFDVSNVPTGTTKTYAVPAITTSSDVLVTQDATQELKNKTIDGNLNTLTNLDFGTLSGEVNPQNGGTGISNPAGATLTRTGAFDLNITCTAETDVTMPVSGTLATLTDISASNLTGTVPLTKGGLGTDASAFSGVVKVSGGTASASSIANADISATAAIARSKVASGTANHIVINDGTGVLSSEATLAKSRGGSGQDNTNLTFPSTGTLATLAGSETLSSKTLLENTVDNFLAFNEEAAAPATPASGKVAVYAKSDSKIYKKDSTGAESEIGAGGSGTGRNYLQDWFDGTKPIGTIQNTSDTGNRSSLINWAASDVTKLTLSATFNTTNPLRQTSDYKITHVAIGAAFIETPQFVLDIADLGKPVSIEFDLTGVVTANDFDVCVVRFNTGGIYQEKISVAGTASTGSPASAQLPTGTTKFRGFFVAGSTSTDRYAVRIRRLSASAAYDVQIDSLFVGPQSLAQGAVVTAWQSYTPTFSNLVGGANISFKWRRVGSNVEINGRFQTTTASPSSSTLVIGIPSGLTIDSNSISDFALINQYGTASLYLLSTSLTQTNKFSVALESGTAGTSAFILTQSAGVARVRESDLGQNNYVEVSCTIPISQWSSGTTTLADRAVEEYAWNSNTANSNDLTSFAYGPDGTQFGSYSSATVTKRVRFQTPILSTDSIILEAKDGANAQWVPYHQSRYASLSSTTGMACAVINTTDVDVYFGSSGYAATVYAGASAWSGVAGTNTYKWRLRKVSGGAAVGFPVSARNIVGDTSGSVVPTGMIGEIISSKTSAATATTTGVYFDAATITLAASGTYRLDSSVRYVLNGATITLWQGELFFGTTTGNSSAGFDLNENYWNVPSPANSNADCSINATQVINYNSTTGLVTFSGGATMTLTGGVLRLKSRPGGFTGGPVQYRAFLTATRIA